MAQRDDERAWVEMARAGNPEAIGWLYERYVDPIYRYVYLKVGDPTEAEDITEQVFLKMIEAIEGFQWKGYSFSSWLYRIAHNQIVDTLRQRARRQQVPIEALQQVLPMDGYDPQHHAERSDFLSHLKEAMTHLTDLQAQVITLKYAAGMSNAQAAEIMSRTENSVNALQYDALKNLQKLLGQKGFKP